MKRKRKARRDERVEKRQKVDDTSSTQSAWPLLRCYYPDVMTLRQYLVAKLSRSKKRQRKLLKYGLGYHTESVDDHNQALVTLLDNTAVGTALDIKTEVALQSIDKDITIFTQLTQQMSAATSTVSPTQGSLKQNEIVDFTVWRLFRNCFNVNRPSHILTHGYQSYVGGHNAGAAPSIVPGVPGVWSNGVNRYVENLKSAPWTALPPLLGRNAESIISDMLLHCGLFGPVDESCNLTQLSGFPLSDLKGLKAEQSAMRLQTATKNTHPNTNHISLRARGLSEIRMVRHRMFYARPAVNGKGEIGSGLGYVHVFNRYTDINDHEQTRHVLKYVFPRQFKLHNVFTSPSDRQETSLRFKDYTIREQEIHGARQRWRQRKRHDPNTNEDFRQPLPKRLRGATLELMRQTRRNHLKCSYKAMLEHHCPHYSTDNCAHPVRQATALAQVSAFCRSVICKVFPTGWWGSGEDGQNNRKRILQRVDQFVRMRKQETISLHDLLQNVKIASIGWLEVARDSKKSSLSRPEFTKRQELLAEWVYYLFDSFLVPLIRGHFYVTESNTEKNQLFYFRHDVWKAISEPALFSLKANMLEPCNTAHMKRDIAKRDLGVSKVRLLPKQQGMRPIINLRRRVQQVQRGKLVLGKSINSILTPAFSILNYEKERNPGSFGSALFSVGDIFPQLQEFRKRLEKAGMSAKPLYFAKVDVKACFDTIPQKRLMELAKTILHSDSYNTTKYNRGKIVGGHDDQNPGFGAWPFWKYITKATAKSPTFDFEDAIKIDSAEGHLRSVYVDGAHRQTKQRKAVIDLLEEHIRCNIITIGKRLYRQKEGIPQGSVLSSILCNYFYADLERKVLDFVVNDPNSVMFRLIDDFLVISTEKPLAERFVRTMHAGVPEFGVAVKAEKSRTNFELVVNGMTVSQISPEMTGFPYCGNAIDMVTLDLSKDLERWKQSNISDSVTVEYSRLPGQTFYRKTLKSVHALKLHMQAMLLSTSYNSLATVRHNLQHCFTDVASKMYQYMRALPAAKRPTGRLVIRAIDDLIKLACKLMRRKASGKGKYRRAIECSIEPAQTRWIACRAFADVFRRRQTMHGELLAWLEAHLQSSTISAREKKYIN